MNRGHILQSSPVQQMMATGKPSCWWSSNNIRPAISQFEHHQQQQPQGAVPPSPFYPFSSAPPPPLPPATNTNTTTTTNNNNYNIIFPHQLLMNMTTAISASSSLPFAPSSSSSWGPSVDSNQQEQLPAAEPWNQLFMGAGMAMSGDEKAVMNHQFQTKKIEDWEDHHEVLGIHHHQQHQPSPPTSTINVDHVKQENSAAAGISYVYGHDSCSTTIHEDYRAALKPITTAAAAAAAWSPHHQMMPVSSPQSCVTTFSNNNLLDFSSPISDARHPPPPPAPSSDRSSECNSTANTTSGGPTKKAKVQPSSTQSTIKVRKEKLGDRITALHQLVSPFGKTDTASVLLEALGYIRFLHNQIEALSLPYLANTGSGNNKRQPQTTVQGERNSIFPEEPGQLLNNNNCLKRKGGPDPQDSSQEEEKNLRSRGLCLVPISCTLLVGSDNGADYWAPPALGGAFR